MQESCCDALGALRRGDPAPFAAWLRRHLHEHVLSFWERFGFEADGGLVTCLDDTGRVLSHDKWMWSQWRAVWTFSRVYAHSGDTRWLDRARRILEFSRQWGQVRPGGGWALVLSRHGQILRGWESIYTDAFAICGLTEFGRVTGDEDALRLAMQTADRALDILAGPVEAIPHFPYPIPVGAKPHGLPMIWSLVLAELGAVAKEKRYLKAANAMATAIFGEFYRRDRDVVLEFIRGDGSEFSPPEGTAIVPGHVIEGMWFQIHVADLIGLGPDRTAEACRLVLRHLELGWDSELGGLLLAVDADGRDTVGWRFASSKLWWPHTEALYATLLGWSRTGQPAFLDWYERLWRVCLDHFVDWVHGEWRQRLDRHFRPLTATVALPVKDPFHLPRSLLLQLELLDRLATSPVPAKVSPPSP